MSKFFKNNPEIKNIIHDWIKDRQEDIVGKLHQPCQRTTAGESLTDNSLVSRPEVAAQILVLAKTLCQDGKIKVEGVAIAVPEKLKYKTKYKAKKNWAKIKLSLIWPLGGQGTFPDNFGSSVSFKKTKKKMERLIHQFERSLTEGNFPTADQLDQYAALEANFKEEARPSWISAIDECHRVFLCFYESCLNKNACEASAQLNKLLQLKEKYHAKYK